MTVNNSKKKSNKKSNNSKVRPGGERTDGFPRNLHNKQIIRRCTLNTHLFLFYCSYVEICSVVAIWEYSLTLSVADPKKFWPTGSGSVLTRALFESQRS